MKKLHKYIIKDTFKTLVPAFVTLALIMEVGFCMQLINDGLDVIRLRALLVPLFKYCVPMVLPSAFLTAVIMTFGRLASDNELIAVRAAGIPLFRIVLPVLLGGAVLSVLAAYLQFETVPRANGSIKTLKHRALKQILLDKVALGARRQLSIKPAYIQYDDFKDGQMIGLLVLEVRDRRPCTIVTAATCNVLPDPHREEVVLFEMKKPVMWLLESQEQGETIVADEAIMRVTVAPSAEEVLSADKFLRTGDLLKKVQQLNRKATGQPLLENPERVRKREERRKRELQIEIDEVNAAYRAARSRRNRYADDEPRVQQQLIDQNRRAMGEAEQQIEDRRRQMKEVLKKLDKMQEASDATQDYAIEVDLRRTHAELQREIVALTKQTKALQQEIAEAEGKIKASRKKAATLDGEVRELKALNYKLRQRKERIAERIELANVLDDLRAIKMRIHKRLALAVSVFVFALLGIPLGIRIGGRNVMTAFGLSFAVVLLLFYPFLIVGEMAAGAGALPVAPAIWGGNAITAALGAVLMVKVVRC